MKPTTGILVLMIAAGSAFAQNPKVVENTRTKVNAVAQKQSAATKPAPAATKPAPAATKPTAVQPAKPVAVAAKPLAVTAKPAAATGAPAAAQATAKKPAPKAVVAVKPAPSEKEAVKASPKPATEKKSDSIAVENAKTPPADVKKDAPKEINLTGRRDPFLSPVVNRSATGSGCSTGKRCLAIDQISLKGIVKSDNGMIAVVVNALEKAYFLRENDPVFNGYVVKITGDSIIFKETIQDKLGKPFTREVTKKISTPAV